MPNLPADTDSRRIPGPRRPPDPLDDAGRLALLAADLITDRLDRYAAQLGSNVVLDLAVATLQAQVADTAVRAWAAWTVRAAR